MEAPPVELASRQTMGVSIDEAIDLETRVERMVERQLVRLGSRGLEAGEKLARDAAPGSRMALSAMLLSLATVAMVLAFVVLHEMGTSRFERAIEDLIDVLRHQNAELSEELNNVERRMHRR